MQSLRPVEFNPSNSAQSRIVVLMYHGTTVEKPSSSYSIKATTFRRHIKFLKKSGWRTVLFRELLNPTAIPNKTIVITFDDGYADNYDGAFSALLENDMKATWFITTQSIGKHAHWMGENRQETKMLTRGQLREMQVNGMEIASHTHSHPDLSGLTYTEQLSEMRRSKELIEAITKQEIVSFAYPFGRYNEDSLRAVADAGYSIAASCRPGYFTTNGDPLRAPRLTIFDTDSVNTLSRKLRFVDNDVSFKKLVGYYSKRLASRFTSDSKISNTDKKV